jgi:hypothetical protein
VAEMLQHQHGERVQEDTEHSLKYPMTIKCMQFFHFYQSASKDLLTRISKECRSRTTQCESKLWQVLTDQYDNNGVLGLKLRGLWQGSRF